MACSSCLAFVCGIKAFRSEIGLSIPRMGANPSSQFSREGTSRKRPRLALSVRVENPNTLAVGAE